MFETGIGKLMEYVIAGLRVKFPCCLHALKPHVFLLKSVLVFFISFSR